MADNSFRSSRNRDALVRDSAAASSRALLDDPLAELARLIGQSDPNDIARADQSYASPRNGQDRDMEWAAADTHAEQGEAIPPGYEHDDDERYDAPRLAEPAPAYRSAVPSQDIDFGPIVSQRFMPAGEVAPRQREMPPQAAGRQLQAHQVPARQVPSHQVPSHQVPAHQVPAHQVPTAVAQPRGEIYAYDEDAQGNLDDQGYGGEDAYGEADYEEETPTGRRRGALLVIAAVLGLAVFGTAGAFAYRAMFGGSMLPTLPPIIKADTGPTKIMPNSGNAQGKSLADANGNGSGEKLVSREEQPVDVPVAPNPSTPRVVSTIPIFPDPNPSLQGVLASGGAGIPGGLGSAGASPVPYTPPAGAAAAAGDNPAVSAPVSSSAAPANAASPGPKKIHTVVIRPDQMGVADASAAAPSQPVARAPAVRQIAPAAPKPMAATQAGANGPLSIIPGQGDSPPAAAPRVRTALAHPAEIEAAPAVGGGGYAVQVSSQRSEADAQTAFHALATKFPNQLGGRQPIVRRADLGAKGVFYRALVGPFASMDQAAGMCSSLKAAGGNCIVQRN
jgi:hypothetical protein